MRITSIYVWAEKPGRVFQWESPCQDPQYLDSCDKLWAVIDDRDASTVRNLIFRRIGFSFTMRKKEKKEKNHFHPRLC